MRGLHRQAHRHAHAKRAAQPRRALNGDVAAHQPGQPLRDLEPETGALAPRVGTRGGALEHQGAFEQAVQRVGIHADTGVGDFDLDQRLAFACWRHASAAQLDAAAAGETDRVGHQVVKHLAQARAVELQPSWQRAVDLRTELQALGSGRRAHQALDLAQQC